MIDKGFQKTQFRAIMVVFRHLSEIADREMAEYYFRELKRELPELEKKFRAINTNVVIDSVADAPPSV